MQPKRIIFTKLPTRIFTKRPTRHVVFLSKGAMPAGPVDTGPVFMLTDAMTERYDKDPSVLADLLKECADRKLTDMEGNIEIRHPKGYSLGLWNGMLSTLDPAQSPPSIQAPPILKSHVNGYTRKNGVTVKPHEDSHAAATGRMAADDHAEAAVAIANRVSPKSTYRDDALASSQEALVATRGTKKKRDHLNAAHAHERAMQLHRNADHFQKYEHGLGGARNDHRAAAQSHEWASAAHREAASGRGEPDDAGH